MFSRSLMTAGPSTALSSLPRTNVVFGNVNETVAMLDFLMSPLNMTEASLLNTLYDIFNRGSSAPPEKPSIGYGGARTKRGQMSNNSTDSTVTASSSTFVFAKASETPPDPKVIYPAGDVTECVPTGHICYSQFPPETQEERDHMGDIFPGKFYNCCVGSSCRFISGSPGIYRCQGSNDTLPSARQAA